MDHRGNGDPAFVTETEKRDLPKESQFTRECLKRRNRRPLCTRDIKPKQAGKSRGSLNTTEDPSVTRDHLNSTDGGVKQVLPQTGGDPNTNPRDTCADSPPSRSQGTRGRPWLSPQGARHALAWKIRGEGDAGGKLPTARPGRSSKVRNSPGPSAGVRDQPGCALWPMPGPGVYAVATPGPRTQAHHGTGHQGRAGPLWSPLSGAFLTSVPGPGPGPGPGCCHGLLDPSKQPATTAGPTHWETRDTRSLTEPHRGNPAADLVLTASRAP